MNRPDPDTSLFITGGSGFLGQCLLRHLARGSERSVTCLSRRPDLLRATEFWRPHWTCVPGDLADPATYRDALAQAGTVVHLAAATGKERPSVFREVNVEGTRQLVQHATRAGVARFVFVSSIAAKFADQRHYPYAQSKLEAEHIVTAVAPAWVIIRPTLVFGATSPVLRGLIKLVKGPVAVVFGTGKVQVQPIDVDDVAELLVAAAGHGTWDGQVIEAGGPDVLSFADLLLQIRTRLRGQGGRLVRLPLGPIRTLVAALEPALLSHLPFSAGQLAAFANDSTAERHALVDRLRPSMKTIDLMLDVVQGAR